MATTLTGEEREVFQLAKDGSALWTRDWASRLREEIESIIGKMSADSLMVINASGVKVFDFSFASEFFAKLVLRFPNEYPGRCIAVSNLAPHVRENLEAALYRAGVMMLELVDKTWELIGKFSGADENTLKALSDTGKPISATDLAAQLNIRVTACNERLARLTRFGLIHRLASQSGRVQYLYSFVH